MEIFSNGDVSICKQAFDAKQVKGNFNTNTLAEIQKELKNDFILNYNENYNEMKICTSCDEWYTYNF